MMMRTGAVILAAGHISPEYRFQPMLPIGNTTIIKRIIITLKRAGVEPIILVTGQDAEELEKHVSKMRVACVRNDAYGTTPMFESIRIGLNYIEDLCDRALVLPVKYPMFLEETVIKLLGSDAQVACPVYQGKKGHPILVSSSYIKRFLSYKGDGGVEEALNQKAVAAVLEELEVEDAGIIYPIETPEDCVDAKHLILAGKITMHPSFQVYLEKDERFFGPGIAQFLMLVGHTGSMQTACKQMHMSYSKGWKIMKTAERQMGYPLLITQSGGSDGGFSQLTPKAEDFLKRFLSMEEELRVEAERVFKKYYGDGEELGG